MPLSFQFHESHPFLVQLKVEKLAEEQQKNMDIIRKTLPVDNVCYVHVSLVPRLLRLQRDCI